MIHFIFLLLFFLIFNVHLLSADVFKLNEAGVNGDALRQAIGRDSKGLYFKDSVDTNITSFSSNPFNYRKNESLDQSISQKFPYTDNLNKQIIKPFMKNQDVGQLLNYVKSSGGLLNYQYTSPAEVDLLKFYTTIGQMRLGMFYEQARDLEKEFGGPLDVLRRQGLYDCLKSSSSIDNLPERVVECSNNKDYFGPLFKSEDIGGNELDVLLEVFHRLNLRDKDIINQVKMIVPQWVLMRNGYRLNGPAKRIGSLFADYREEFITRMKEILESYQQNKTVSEDDLLEFSMPSVQLTEQQVRDLFMMDDDAKEILISKWGAYWARVKTIEQYELALEWFERARIHPLVKGGFKAVIEEDRSFVLNELDSFKHQRESYADYAQFMRFMLEETEGKKQYFIKEIKVEKDQGKVLNLNGQ